MLYILKHFYRIFYQQICFKMKYFLNESKKATINFETPKKTI